MARMTDAFICDAVRTPIGRYGGALAAVRADDLAAIPIAALLKRNPSLEPAAVDECCSAAPIRPGRTTQRGPHGAAAGGPATVSVPGRPSTVPCGSGLDALAMAARIVRAGEAEVVIAGGVESMSRAPFVIPKAEAAFSRAAAIYDMYDRLALRQSAPREALRHRLDAGDRRERGRTVPHRAR